jgi:hypothetical protein
MSERGYPMKPVHALMVLGGALIAAAAIVRFSEHPTVRNAALAAGKALEVFG